MKVFGNFRYSINGICVVARFLTRLPYSRTNGTPKEKVVKIIECGCFLTKTLFRNSKYKNFLEKSQACNKYYFRDSNLASVPIILKS